MERNVDKIKRLEHELGRWRKKVADTAKENEELREALAQLDDHSRTAIVFKTYEDMTFREIAQVTGRPENTVKSDYYRGLRLLKERMNCHDV